MKKKLFTLLLTIVLVFAFSMSAMAESKAERIKTSGGTSGTAVIIFNCSCQQETGNPTNFFWSSNIVAPRTALVTSWQSGKILMSNNTQMLFSTDKITYSYVTKDALKGGWAEMSTSSIEYGGARTIISVTR